MIDIEKILKVIAEKLISSKNMQEAIGKGVWVAYNEGLLEGLKGQSLEKSAPIKRDLKRSYTGVFNMGFNLEQFFYSLESVFENTKLSDKEKAEEAARIITKAKNYAKECHQL